MKRFNYWFKLLFFSLAVILVAQGISSYIAYEQDKANLEKSLASELLSIVRTAAPFVDGDLHQLIQLTPEGHIENMEEFQAIRTILEQVKFKNNMSALRGSPIYTLRKTKDFETTGKLEFVVMTDRDEHGKYYTGHLYDATPHNLQALQGKDAVTGVYEDSEGVWISACTPIMDSRGQVVGILQADRPVDYFYAHARSMALKVFMGAVAGFGIAALMAAFFARGLVRPIKKLVAAHEKFGGGKMEIRLDDNRNDELGDLMKSFNSMASTIQKTRQEIEDANRTLELKVEQRTLELKDKNAMLVALNDEKNEFMGIAAHDLKNPLTAVMGNAQLAQLFIEDVDTPAKKQVHEVLDAVVSASKRMYMLINNLLDVNAIEQGKVKVNMKLVDPVKMFAQVSKDYLTRAKNKNIEIVEDFEVRSAIEADESVLVQIFDNLISNAIKYSPSDKKVFLRATEREQHVRFIVQDEGPGLSEDDQKKLFGKFMRLSARPTAGESSNGLGLSIVKRMVEVMNGKVWCESSLGQGASFIVEFPRAITQSHG